MLGVCACHRQVPPAAPSHRPGDFEDYEIMQTFLWSGLEQRL